MVKIKIGTLSIRREAGRNPSNRPCPIKEILYVVTQHKPDLLLCAGDFLKENTDLNTLAGNKAISCANTVIVVDYDIGKGKSKTKGSGNPLFLIEPGGKVSKLATQCVACANDFSALENPSVPRNANVLTCFNNQLSNRIFTVNNIKCSCLLCGEINFFAYSKKNNPCVQSRFGTFSKHYDAVQLIVNPTHDRMGDHGGLLTAKRKYLSRPLNGRKRCYVSASNWDAKKLSAQGHRYSQRPDANNLHTVYVADNAKHGGRKDRKKTLCTTCTTKMVEYREVEITL